MTLVLVCEEGIEEYQLDKYPQKDIYIRVVDDVEEITPEFLTKLEDELEFSRVIIEYNGMWMLDELYKRLPDNWQVYQEMLFVDYTTFHTYNANMRSLVVDKLTSCELTVFNRCPVDVDKMQLHKIVRTTNRRCDIAYEYCDGSVDYDDIEDPLPFDVNAPIIEIADEDFAVWYRDTTEKIETYDGKTVKFKACIKRDPKEKKIFVAGRQVMTCCVDDTRFAGYICEYSDTASLNDGAWAIITAKIAVKYHKIYKRKGPVLSVTSVEACSEPDDPIATFY